MSTATDQPVLHVPARDVPVPSSISPEAQAMLAESGMPPVLYPALDDAQGSRDLIAFIDEMTLSRFTDNGLMATEGFDFDELRFADRTTYVITPTDLDPADQRVFFDPHGGAFIIGAGELCRGTGIMTARKFGMRVWSPDYRMPPDHPYPAGLDDCMAAYRGLLDGHDPRDIVVGGVSAGGNFAAALILRARDEGLPMPGAAILLTPGTDLTCSGDTFQTNRGVDTVLTDSEGIPLKLYAGGHDPTHPYLSPVNGDFSRGFPPTLLASGTRDVLLSDTVRLHRALRAADVVADLHVLEAAPHGFFRGTTPEDLDLAREVCRFIDQHCPVRP